MLIVDDLLRNAYESLLENDVENRQVKIDILPADGNWMIQIEDNGPGISPDIIDNIFAPFYSTKQQGMGMGLAISRTILDAHNSKLTARTEKTRTVFEFYLAQEVGGRQP